LVRKGRSSFVGEVCRPAEDRETPDGNYQQDPSKSQPASAASRLLVGNRLLHDAPLSSEAGNAHVDEHRPHTGQSCWQSAATTNIVRTADFAGRPARRSMRPSWPVR
jgi:hypothetical protein